MAWKPQDHALLILLLAISVHFLCSFTMVDAKSRRPISDSEIRMKKDACYADIESGMWGSACRASTIGKENCALLCLSPKCYGKVYEHDPLEEGEKDLVRSQQYKFCLYRYLDSYDASVMNNEELSLCWRM